MRAANEVEVVAAEELCDNVLAKGEGHAAVILSPANNVLIRIRPQEIAQEARVGHCATRVMHVTNPRPPPKALNEARLEAYKRALVELEEKTRIQQNNGAWTRIIELTRRRGIAHT